MRDQGATWSICLLSVAALTSCDSPELEVKAPEVRVVRETIGLGRPADSGDMVRIAYDLRTTGGEEILSSDSFEFRLDRGAVVLGIDQSVMGMRKGGERRTILPPDKHWGRDGYGDGAVPRNATLTLDVKLLACEPG